MKVAYIFLVLLFSFSVSARQYIQCSAPNSFDRFVINLNEDQSTFFYTNGVHLPDDTQINSLSDLNFYENTSGEVTYSTSVENKNLIVRVKKENIDRAANYLEIEFNFVDGDYNLLKALTVSCFSSLYND